MRLRVIGLAVLPLLSQAAHPCEEPANHVVNCGFPTPGVTAPWTVMSGSCAQNGSNGSSQVGNLTCDSVDLGLNDAVTIFQCVNTLSGSTLYGFGADFELVSGSGVTCIVSIDDNDADGCFGNLGNSDSSTVAPVIGSYTQTPLESMSTDPSATAARLQLFCFADAAFTLRIDDVFVGEGLVPVTLQAFDVD